MQATLPKVNMGYDQALFSVEPSSFVSFSTERNKIHTVPPTSVDDRRCGNETDSVSWVMAVFIEGAVLVMAFGFIAILVIKLRRVTQTRDGSRGKFVE